MRTWNDLDEHEQQRAVRHFEIINEAVPVGGQCDYHETAAEFGLDEHHESTRRALRKRRDVTNSEPEINVPMPEMTGGIEHVQQAFIEYQKAIEQARSELIQESVDLTIDDDRPVGIAFPSDWHIGDIGTDHELLQEHCAVLADTDGMNTIVGGDAVNNFIHPKITDAARADLPPDMQYRWAASLFKILKPLAVNYGNHDQWTEQFAGINALADIATQQAAICTASGAEMRLRIGSQTYIAYRQHRYRYGSSFNLTHTVKRLWEMGPCDFDIGIVDHQHVPAIEMFYKHARPKVAIRAGTYKTRDAWARDKGFYGARIGVPIVFLWPDRWHMQAWPQVDDVAGACKYLEYLRQNS